MSGRTAASEPRETSITQTIIRKLNALDQAHAHKVHGGPYGASGEPDIDACIHGRTVKIEVKRPSQRATLTPLQAKALDRWKAAGAIAFVACSWDEVASTLRTHDLIDG